MQPLSNIHALIIDMDGVLWKGSQALPGLTDFFQALRDLKIPFLLATNNASLTQDQYIDKLASMHVAVSPNEILTSSMATACYLSEQVDPKSSRVFVIGEDGLRQPLIEKGFTLIDCYQNNAEPADFVICGLDRQLIWDKLVNASLHLSAGAKFIATNADTSLPTERGTILGNGAILAALQAATQIKPTIIGKPEPIMYQQAINMLGISPDKTVAIGDRLNTDILGAVNTGIRSLMVLTGISTEADLKTIDYQPTWIMPDIQAVTKALLNNITP
ncbi:MAG: HAD-IIA family hydrolase [Methylococcales bacterium]|nr:HAD-IIA family hydrolase [Methylococcales bacterium]